MAVKFLDYTGLGYFWSKIKAWCNATFAAITHNQASSTINTMTGYSKPSSGSAIVASDSLNTAIGKLEAKVDSYDDNNYVHKTGDETIDGTKTFSNLISGGVTGSASCLASYEPHTASRLYYGVGGKTIGTEDGNAYEGSSNNWKLWSYPEGGTYTTATSANIQDLRFVWNADYFSDIFLSPNTRYIWYRNVTNGTAYGWRRLVEENVSGLSSPNWDINIAGNAATATALVDDSNYVHLTGAESIAGMKTFTENINLIKDYPIFLFKATSITRNTAPSANYAMTEILGRDSAAKNTWALYHKYDTDKTNQIRLICYNGLTTDNSYTSIGVGYDSTGTPFTVAPTPPTADNSVQIATTAFVKAQGYALDNDVVHTSGNESIDGMKTFTSSIRGKTEQLVGADTYADMIKTYQSDNNNKRSCTIRCTNGNGFNQMLLGVHDESDNAPNGVLVQNTAGTIVVKAQGSLETIGDITINDDDPQVIYKYKTPARGTAPSSGYYTFVNEVKDKNGYPFGALYHEYLTSKFNRMSLVVYRGDTTSSNDWSYLGIAYDATNAKYVTNCPNPASNSNTNEIATTKWVNDKGYLTSHQSLSSCVKTSGNQDIAGYKVFTTSLTVKRTSPFLYFIETDANKGGTTPTDYQGLYFCDKNFDSISPNDNYILAQIARAGSTANDNLVVITAKTNTANTNTGYSISFGHTGGKTTSDWYLLPSGNGVVKLGSNAHRWGQIYSSVSTISTSDARVKNSIADVANDVLDAWEQIEWKQFKFNSSVEEKGIDAARLHTGVIAQNIESVFNNSGLDARRYGLFCYDEWEAEADLVNSQGSLLREGGPAGNLYSIRYEEALCMEAAYQRRKNKILENRISELEKQVSDMLQILQSLKGAN